MFGIETTSKKWCYAEWTVIFNRDVQCSSKVFSSQNLRRKMETPLCWSTCPANLAQENGNTTLLVNMIFTVISDPLSQSPPPPDQVALEKRDSISYFPRKRKVNKIRIICETKMRGEKNKFRFINKTGERWIRSGHLWKMVWTVPLATMMNERYLAWFSVHSTNTYLNKAEKNIHAKVKIQNLSSPLIFRDSLDSPFFLGLNSYFIGHGNLWSFLLV